MKVKNKKGKKHFGPSKRGILVKGKWKAVELDPSIFANEAMGEVVCFEELTDYSLVDSEKAASMTEVLEDPTSKKRKKKRKASEIEAEECDVKEDVVQPSSEESPAKKKRKQKKKTESEDVLTGDHSEGIESLDDDGADQTLQDSDDYAELTEETTKKSRKKKKKKKKTTEATETGAQGNPGNEVLVASKRKIKNWTDAALSKTGGTDTDVSAWKQLFVPEPVLKALSKLGFSAPTPIQALALPPAIRDRLDILGAAETGDVTSDLSSSLLPLIPL